MDTACRMFSDAAVFSGLKWTYSYSCCMSVLVPKRQVVTKELHDRGGVFNFLLLEVVQLRNRVVESFLRQFVRFLGTILDFVLENREVQSQAEPIRVCNGQIFFAHFYSFEISPLGFLLLVIVAIAVAVAVAGLQGRNLDQITQIVSLHFQEEHLRLGLARFWNDVIFKQR